MKFTSGILIAFHTLTVTDAAVARRLRKGEARKLPIIEDPIDKEKKDDEMPPVVVVTVKHDKEVILKEPLSKFDDVVSMRMTNLEPKVLKPPPPGIGHEPGHGPDPPHHSNDMSLNYNDGDGSLPVVIVETKAGKSYVTAGSMHLIDAKAQKLGKASASMHASRLPKSAKSKHEYDEDSIQTVDAKASKAAFGSMKVDDAKTGKSGTYHVFQTKAGKKQAKAQDPVKDSKAYKISAFIPSHGNDR